MLHMEIANPISDRVIITTDIVINPDDLNGCIIQIF